MAEGESRVVPLPTPTPWVMARAGHDALKQVPGARKFLIQGFVLTYCISIGLGLLLAVLVYYGLVGPLLERAAGWGEGQDTTKEVASFALVVLIWIGQVMVVLAAQVLAFVITISAMSMWFEALAARIVAFARGTSGRSNAGESFSVKKWLTTIGASLADAVWLVCLTIFALLLSFIPVAGPLAAILINSYVMGRDVRDPYISVRVELGDDPATLTRGLSMWTLRSGLGPVILAMIPGVGWLVLPVFLIHLVAGMAWLGEEAVKAASGAENSREN